MEGSVENGDESLERELARLKEFKERIKAKMEMGKQKKQLMRNLNEVRKSHHSKEDLQKSRSTNAIPKTLSKARNSVKKSDGGSLKRRSVSKKQNSRQASNEGSKKKQRSN